MDDYNDSYLNLFRIVIMNDYYLKGEEHVRMEKQMEVGEFDRALINSIGFNHQMKSNVIKYN